ncbi:transposable element Tcb1 transposase [Trichonephila clavipes]|nr:transposable element Tcb1 transposase [Trichonephila clavipes]
MFRGGVGTSGCERCHLLEDQTQAALDKPFFEKTVLSDEPRLNLINDDNRVRLRRTRGERLNPIFALHRHSAPTAAVMIEVSNKLRITQSLISRLWQRFQEDGNVSRRYNADHSRVTELNKNRYLTITLKRNIRFTASNLSRFSYLLSQNRFSKMNRTTEQMIKRAVLVGFQDDEVKHMCATLGESMTRRVEKLISAKGRLTSY